MTRTRLDRRATLITVGCVAAVAVAGAFAVGANLGILDASADSKIGTLSAAGDLLPATSAPSGAASAPAATAADPAASGAGAPASQTYTVDVAGTVSIAMDGERAVITGVAANPGWTWVQRDAGDDGAHVLFSDGSRVLAFDARPTGGGSFDATVGESAAPATATTTAGLTPVVPVDDHEEHEHEGWDEDD